MRKYAGVRRTQVNRTAETRRALIDAAISAINRYGYGAASTALIAQEAGVSRGAILHHFGTRAVLMADMVRDVFDRELADYTRLLEDTSKNKLHDLPELVWSVLQRPSAMAVLDVLWATRSDTDLASKVLPMQLAIERDSAEAIHQRYGGEFENAVAFSRLLAWAIRGLVLAKALYPADTDFSQPIEILGKLLHSAAPSGSIADLL